VGKYLKLARKVAVSAKEANTAKVVSIDTSRSKSMAQAHALLPSAKEMPRESGRTASHKPATKATEATKAPVSDVPGYCDKSNRSDKRVAAITLTLQEALAEISRQGSGPAKNAELYRRGQLSEEKAVEYVTCAILARRGASFAGWRRHAPAVRKALSLCVHELDPKACKVCNGCART
jgi:hypothetical protein